MSAALQVIAVVIGIGALIAAVRSVLWLFGRVDSVWRTTEAIMVEFRPNGGGSLRDAVDINAVGLASLTTRIVVHEEREQRFETYLHGRIHDLVGELAFIRAASTLPPETVKRWVDEMASRRADDEWDPEGRAIPGEEV